ncbi:MAG TPA: cyclase family protein [Candidatus Limnocylindrales bacterium]|nr:cyclase family protein [Candidatus Limnocylindrales bacterium]
MTGPGGTKDAGWIDISVPLRDGLPIFEGDPSFHIEYAFSIAGGANYNVSRVDMGVHSGTHFDAPLHAIDGAPGSDAIQLDAGLGPAWVVDATALSGEAISAADLASLEIPGGETRLLFKTRNSDLWGRPGFQASFIGLDESAAVALVDRGVRFVAIDYLSIGPFGKAVETHLALLRAGIAILEGADLRNVEPGPVELLCLPIKLIGSDGVPARALVRPRR